jgi:hypothetical protein
LKEKFPKPSLLYPSIHPSYNAYGRITGQKFPHAAGGFDMLVQTFVTGQTVIPPTLYPDLGEPYRWIALRTLFNECV